MDWLAIGLQALPYILGIGIVAAVIDNTRKLLREIADVLVVVDEALADKNITKEEIIMIKKESIDVWEAVKAFGK